MGIRFLNRFLQDNARSSIHLFNLNELSGKKIAVDISIYMYKFQAEHALIENIYLMLSIFRHYNIFPIFIFDGKPPSEKHELLEKRRQDKQVAKNEFNKLQHELENKQYTNESDKLEIIDNMNILKKKFVTINKNEFDNVKKLITFCGATYYDAPGEADELCVMLTIRKRVWACLSEDMDMFVYGCPRVIRYLSLSKHTAVVYDVDSILNDLGISQKQLRQICVLAGTDYNLGSSDTKNTLNNVLKLFKKYIKCNSNIDFYTWLNENNKNYIKNINFLLKINDMFDLNAKHLPIDNIEIVKKPIFKENVKSILKTDGFIFPN